LSLNLCGGVTVTGELGTLGPRQLGGSKSRQILMALSARPGHPVSKTHLVHLLWGDKPPLDATGTVETYISLLRKRFDGLTTRGGAVIRTVPGGYGLDPAGIRIDVDAFDHGCRAAREPGLPAGVSLDRWSVALGTITGDFLAGEEGLSWVDEARQLHELRLAGALAEAAETALRVGAWETAEHFAARGLTLDGLHESCWQFLLESYEARGLHADGVRAYDECRRSFAEELGCAPGPSVQAAFQRLLTGTAGATTGGLNAAMEAVVRLYTSITPGATGMPGGGDVTTHPSVVEDAYQLLHDLLLRADATGSRVALSA
jgi:DNA-binding SARP family transcriptional activator